MVDVDEDGDLDILIGTGFLACEFFPTVGTCGGLHWFEQGGEAWVRHDIVPVGAELFYHGGQLVDLDQDGILDLVTVGERRPAFSPDETDRAEVQWFKGTTDDLRFETTPRVIGNGLGALVTVIDLDEDGMMDLASAEYFADMGASFSWFRQVAPPSDSKPAGVWERHVIDDEVGPSIQLSFIPDLWSDGGLAAVGSNHTNTAAATPDPWESTVYAYDIPDDPAQPWPKTKISEHIVSVPGSGRRRLHDLGPRREPAAGRLDEGQGPQRRRDQ